MNSNPSSPAPQPKNNEEFKTYADGSYRYVLKITDMKLGRQAAISVPDIDNFTHKKWSGSRKWVVVEFLEEFRRGTESE